MSLYVSIPVRRQQAMSLGAIVLLSLCSCGLSAQQAAPTSAPAGPPAAPEPANRELVHLKDYSKPSSAFPNILRPYEPYEIPMPNFGNSGRIDTLLRDGKIYLSINDAVALSLENNLDIEIARYNLNIADADLLRAKSGSNILGVNTGVVQN